MNIDKKFSSIKIGQTVILKLSNDVVVGKLILLKPNSHLRLKDCRDYSTNEDLGANCIYYLNEIKDIRVFEKIENNKENSSDDDYEEDEEETNGFKSSFENINESLSKEEETDQSYINDKSKRILLKDERLFKIRELLQSIIYINQYDTKYFNSIHDIKEERQIGIQFEDIRYGRKSNVSILTVLTSKQIYIFDVLLLKGINKELKEVFESSSICKIIHFSKMTHDYLKNVCHIEMHFFFDTMVSEKNGFINLLLTFCSD